MELLTGGTPSVLQNTAMSSGLQAWNRVGTPWIGSALRGTVLGGQDQESRGTWGCQEGKGPFVVHDGDGTLET